MPLCKDATVVVVGIERVRLAAGHNVRAEAKRVALVDSRNRSYMLPLYTMYPT